MKQQVRRSGIAFLVLGAIVWMVAGSHHVAAQEAATEASGTTEMREDVDGVLERGEYVVISTNGSVTRALCPYTCEMRGIPEEHCKTWRSANDPEKCYVKDTRISSDAIPGM